jgi:hypothetical protein
VLLGLQGRSVQVRAVVLLSRTAVLLQAVLQVVVVVVVATRVAVVSGPVLVLLLLLLLLLLKVGWTPRLSSEEFDPAAAWTVGTAPPVVDLPLPLPPVAAARVCRPSHLRPAAV